MTEWEKACDPDRSSIQNFIFSFCAAFKIWNDTTFSSYEAQGQKISGGRVVADYNAFARSFVCPSTNLLLPSYGTDASFDPDRLTITAVVEGSDVSEVFFDVRSALADIFPSHADFKDQYVARVVMIPHLMLEQIFYVDPYPENGLTHLPSL